MAQVIRSQQRLRSLPWSNLSGVRRWKKWFAGSRANLLGLFTFMVSRQLVFSCPKTATRKYPHLASCG
jgi:hypothetical protein